MKRKNTEVWGVKLSRSNYLPIIYRKLQNIYIEYRCGRLIQNFGQYLRKYTVSRRRRQLSSYSPPSERETSHYQKGYLVTEHRASKVPIPVKNIDKEIKDLTAHTSFNFPVTLNPQFLAGSSATLRLKYLNFIYSFYTCYM